MTEFTRPSLMYVPFPDRQTIVLVKVGKIQGVLDMSNCKSLHISFIVNEMEIPLYLHVICYCSVCIDSGCIHLQYL